MQQCPFMSTTSLLRGVRFPSVDGPFTRALPMRAYTIYMNTDPLPQVHGYPDAPSGFGRSGLFCMDFLPVPAFRFRSAAPLVGR